MAADLLAKVSPIYPESAKKAKISGTVVLRAIVRKDGTVEHLAYISGPVQLIQAAIDAVHQWRYKPVFINGGPVRVDTTVSVVFTLRKREPTR